MQRPRASQGSARLDGRTRYLILDGYVDEPAALGVPPFISPHVRSLAGGLVVGGASRDEVGYITVDQWRDLRGRGVGLGPLNKLEVVVLVAGCIVPGKYLRGTPISRREAAELRDSLSNSGLFICGPAARSFEGLDVPVSDADMGVAGSSIASGGTIPKRDRTLEEWDMHLLEGAYIIERHPDFPSPLIVEIDTSRGCPRYISGGCSFCAEPRKGPIQFRQPEAVRHEVAALARYGAENIRVGGQSDLVSYGSPEAGRCEVPVPDPKAVEELMQGVFKALYSGAGIERAVKQGRRPGIDCGIVHTDNANPAVIADHPSEAVECLKAIVRSTTPGNVLAFGLESSDPKVRARNNLNSTPEQAMDAVEAMNGIGNERGQNGLPWLLPGINFLGGLPGQTTESFDLDIRFLDEVLRKGLMLRRINIRAAMFEDGKGGLKDNIDRMGLTHSFRRFRERVRHELDTRFLRRLLPKGTVMKGVFMEASLGATSFGRQIGSYPILVGVEHRVEMGAFKDIAITEVSSRSATGFSTPFRLKDASFRDLQALPGIGSRRAASIFRSPPNDIGALREVLKGEEWVADHIVLK